MKDHTVRRVVTRIERVPAEVAEDTAHYGESVRAPERVAQVMSFLLNRAQEEFWVLLLDSKHRLRATQHVSTGTLMSSLVHPREVFAPAMVLRAAAIIVVHNHPSGESEPSSEDLAVTRRLIEAGKLLGIPLLDHVIVAEDGHTSLRHQMDEF